MFENVSSYRKVLSAGNIKRKRQDNEGYDNTEHRSCLMNQIGGYKKTQTVVGKNEECIQMDSFQAMNAPTEQHREPVIIFIGHSI